MEEGEEVITEKHRTTGRTQNRDCTMSQFQEEQKRSLHILTGVGEMCEKTVERVIQTGCC